MDGAAQQEAPSETRVADGLDVQREEWTDEELQLGLALCAMLAEMGAPWAEGVSAPRSCGSVEKFARKRGFGVIAPDGGGGSLFAHWTQIKSNDKWPQLVAGMRVEYTERREDGKLVATYISALGGGPITAEEDAEKQKRTLSPFVVRGTVLWFHKAGYGFITSDTALQWPSELPAGSRFYVSREELVIAEGSTCALEKGMRVQFRVYEPPGKPAAAAEVTAIGGAPLLCEGKVSAWVEKTGSIIKCRGGTDRLVLGVKKTIHKEPRALTVASRVPFMRPKGQQRTGVQDGEDEEHGGADPLTTSILEALAELQQNVQSPEEAGQPRSGTMRCRFFAEARCSRGASCTFAHDPNAEPAAEGVDAAGWLGSGQVACRFFARGRCAKGITCAFSHAPGAREEASAPQRPCTFFAQGRCTRAADCAFAHELPALVEIL